MNREEVKEIIKWLYINDKSFATPNDWREEFVKKLEAMGRIHVSFIDEETTLGKDFVRRRLVDWRGKYTNRTSMGSEKIYLIEAIAEDILGEKLQ